MNGLRPRLHQSRRLERSGHGDQRTRQHRLHPCGHEPLPAEILQRAAAKPAYTTVQTIIYRMEEKKVVRRVKKIGNAHVFEPLVTRKAVYRRLIDDLLDLFGGSAAPVMSHLVESGKLSLEDIREAEKALAKAEKKP